MIQLALLFFPLIKRVGSLEFVASDFRDVSRLLTKLLDGKILDVKSLLLPKTQDAIRNVDPQNPGPSFTASLVEGFNSLLTEPALYGLPGFSKVKLRPETQLLLTRFKQDRASVNVVQLNRLLLEDAYPMEIAQVNQFNESRVFSPPYREFAFSPDGQRLAARYYPWEIDVFDLKGQVIEKKTSLYSIASVAFSPKGNSVWARAYENGVDTAINQILIWKNNTDNDDPLRLKFTEPINQAVMSPLETNIAVNSSSTSAIWLWDIEKKKGDKKE